MLPHPLTPVPNATRVRRGCVGALAAPLRPTIAPLIREVCPIAGVVAVRWRPPSARRLHLPVYVILLIGEVCPIAGVESVRWRPPSARRLHLPVYVFLRPRFF